MNYKEIGILLRNCYESSLSHGSIRTLIACSDGEPKSVAEVAMETGTQTNSQGIDLMNLHLQGYLKRHGKIRSYRYSITSKGKRFLAITLDATPDAY